MGKVSVAKMGNGLAETGTLAKWEMSFSGKYPEEITSSRIASAGITPQSGDIIICKQAGEIADVLSYTTYLQSYWGWCVGNYGIQKNDGKAYVYGGGGTAVLDFTVLYIRPQW